MALSEKQKQAIFVSTYVRAKQGQRPPFAGPIGELSERPDSSQDRDVAEPMDGELDPDAPDCFLRLSVDLRNRLGCPSEYVLKYQGPILTGDNADVVVGDFSAYVVDLERAYYEGEHPFDVLDSVNAGLAHFCPIVTHEGVFKRSLQRMAEQDIGRLLIIDRVALEPEHRRMGLGLAAIKVAYDHLGYCCSLTMLRAFPLQWEGRAEENPRQFRRDRAKLVQYYRRAGFVPVLGDGLMVRSLP